VPLTEVDRGSERFDDVEDLDVDGERSLCKVKSGASMLLEGNLLVIVPLKRGGNGGTEDKSNLGGGASRLDDFLETDKGRGVKSKLSARSLMFVFHSSSQAGIIWSTHSQPFGF
jgi:hypothetical protein